MGILLCDNGPLSDMVSFGMLKSHLMVWLFLVAEFAAISDLVYPYRTYQV